MLYRLSYLGATESYYTSGNPSLRLTLTLGVFPREKASFQPVEPPG